MAFWCGFDVMDGWIIYLFTFLWLGGWRLVIRRRKDYLGLVVMLGGWFV